MKALNLAAISWLAATLLTTSVSAADRVSSVDLGRAVTVVGRLGQPLGHVVRIEGAAVESDHPRGKGQDNTLFFRIATVEGRALPKPVVIEIVFFSSSNTRKLLAGERQVLLGYETGRFSGLPDEATPHLSAPPAMTGYGFTTEFVVLK